MRLTDDDIAGICIQEIDRAQGYSSDVLDSKRQAALNAYYGLTPEAVAGRSSMVSMDVSDGVHAVLAQVIPVLKSTEVEFVPNGQEDETQAQTETDFVRSEIQKAGGWHTLASALHDALLIANGWLKVTAETDREEQVYEYPAGLSDEELFMVQQVPDAESVKVSQGKNVTRVTATIAKQRLVIECVPPECMLFSEDMGQFKLGELRFVAERKLYTAASLAEMGIDSQKIDAIPDYRDGVDSMGMTARRGIYAWQGDDQAVQDAEKVKEVYCCYIRISLGDNNKSQLRHVWIGGNDVLLNEPADYVPYITGSACPVPHRIQGTGLYELLGDVQNAKTHILRQYLDNLAVMNSSRVGAVEGQVNMNDLTNGRPNGVVRLRSPDAIVPLPAGDIGPQAMAGLQYLDSVTSSRIGAAVDFNEIQSQLMATSATAAAGQLAKVEQMSGWFAGNLANTLLMPLVKMVHHVLRTQMAGPVMAKIAGKWQQTDTSQWPARTVTDVNMGMTTTERAERKMALTEVIQQQTAIMTNGLSGQLTDLPRMYAAMSDWIRSVGLGDPTQYLIDPATPEAQQAAQQSAQQAQEQEAKMAQMQQQMMQMQHQFELQKQDNDLKFKYYDANLDAEIKEADITSKAVIEVKKLNKAGNDERDDKEGGRDAARRASGD